MAVGISVAIGLALGLAAGYFGGLVDEAIMRGVDVMLCFPSFFLILAVIAFLEPSLTNIMVVIGATSWMGVARLVRAETLTLRRRDFVLAAKVAGASPLRIIAVHILPNAVAPVLVSATLGVAGAILVESSLSFLGLGVQPPHAQLGQHAHGREGRAHLRPLAVILPRAGHPRHRAGLQSPGRGPARPVRPAPARLNSPCGAHLCTRNRRNPQQFSSPLALLALGQYSRKVIPSAPGKPISTAPQRKGNP